MIKNIIAALAGLAIAVPVQARIESSTVPLIDLIETLELPFRFNTSECNEGEYLGVYRHSGMQRAFILCPGEEVTALDHMVVRHEAIHAIQHCVNVARGTDVFTPVINDDEKLMAWVREYLDEEAIAEIKVSTLNHTGRLSSKRSLVCTHTRLMNSQTCSVKPVFTTHD